MLNSGGKLDTLFSPAPGDTTGSTHGLERASHASAALASKGRLIRCTVPGSTPNWVAILRTPGLPGVARAFLMQVEVDPQGVQLG